VVGALIFICSNNATGSDTSHQGTGWPRVRTIAPILPPDRLLSNEITAMFLVLPAQAVVSPTATGILLRAV
jgi:hypothetical protein